MQTLHWQLIEPIDAVVFDCDGTLTAIEGINALASMNGVGPAITALTERAMNETGLNAVLYNQRLQAVRPTKDQLSRLADLYYAASVPHAAAVIQLLQGLNKSVYVISAGLLEAVLPFSQRLGVPKDHVFAVSTKFATDGSYLAFDDTSPLISNVGKEQILQQLKKHHPRLLLIGDGQNDLAAAHAVSRFIGFGGVYNRESIKIASDHYIEARTLTPLLPLCLTQDEVKSLSPKAFNLYQAGLSAYFQI